MGKVKQVWELTKDLSEKWAEFAEQHIQQTVDETLEARQKELILKICGFKSEYGRGWQIDHCNGRSGNSTIGNLISTKVSEKLDRIIGDIQLTPDEIAQIKNEAKKQYLREYKSRMIDNARRLAKKHADEYTKKEVSSALEGAAESVRLRILETS